ncbi:hypothetical protein [Marinobacterium arenosum]|uniref:hypothetical protein n=1 Tax=Marinobacterium arenosum TaxID=2862496 RepID=UPI001C944E68|nr:hypothetical protein [Marinobacterium arenosum]MBY4678664.1 hypothetical protein [Marinobacterium arenosum]
MKRLILALTLLAGSWTSHAAATAKPSPEQLRAANQVLAVTNLHSLTEELILELAQKLPTAKRQPFIELARRTVDMEQIESLTRQHLVEQFTSEELRVLAEFRSTPIGQSITEKLHTFDISLKAHIQQQVAQAVKRLIRQQATTSTDG